MKKTVILLLFAFFVIPVSWATTYYTVDIGAGTEWSLDQITPCNCQPLGNANGDILNVYHDLNLNISTFEGTLLVHSNTVNVSSPWQLQNAFVMINANGNLNVTNIMTSNNSDFFVFGNLTVSSTVNVNESRFFGTGIVDLTSANCSSYLSSFNGVAFNQTVFCGAVTDISAINVNIWDGNLWSHGSPPSSCDELAAIVGDYNTANGNITTAMLWMENYELTIAEGTYVDVCEYLFNWGDIEIENKGSLVQREDSKLTNFGNFKVYRVGQHDQFKYNIWSSPVKKNEHLETIFPNTNPCDMFVFDSEAQAWKYDYELGHQTTCNGNPVTFGINDVIPGGDGEMNRGVGYFVPGPQSSSSIVREFNGTVNNGKISVTVTTTNNGDDIAWYGDDWNMVGNPYPCAIDGFKLWEENAGKRPVISDGLYLWVENATPPYDQFASYLVWNPIGATYIEGSATPFDGIIPSCSGFWVTAVNKGGQGNGNAHKILKFTNEMRVTNGVDLAQTSIRSGFVEESVRQRAWFTLTTDSNNYDQILVGYHPKATDSIDLLYDARMNPGSSKVFFASVVDSVPFTIQGLAPRITLDTQLVELVLGTVDTSQHYITLDSALFFIKNKEVYLVDSLLNTTTRLTLKSPVPIELDTVGVYANRFYLKVVGIHPASVNNQSYVFDGRVWVNAGAIYWDDFSTAVNRVEVYNLLGQLMFSRETNSRNSHFKYPSNLKGIHLIRLYDQNNNVIIKKAFM